MRSGDPGRDLCWSQRWPPAAARLPTVEPQSITDVGVGHPAAHNSGERVLVEIHRCMGCGACIAQNNAPPTAGVVVGRWGVKNSN